MKILLLRDKKNDDVSSLLLEIVIKELKLSKAEAIVLALDDDWTILNQHLYLASGIILIEGQDALWAYFTQGFCKGRGIPLLSYGTVFPAMRRFRDISHVNSPEDFKKILSTVFKRIINEGERWKSQKMLLDKGLPFTVHALEGCIAEHDHNMAALFLKAGFSPDARNHDGIPLLCLAARAGDDNITKLLLHAGAKVDQVALDRGGSALIDAALGKHDEVLESLIAAGADVNVSSKDGQSALIFAVSNGHANAAVMLLKAGADPDATDKLGVSARKYAELFKVPAILEALKK